MRETCSYAFAPAKAVVEMLDSLQGVYDEKVFRLEDIKRVIDDETISVIRMSFFESGGGAPSISLRAACTTTSRYFTKAPTEREPKMSYTEAINTLLPTNLKSTSRFSKSYLS